MGVTTRQSDANEQPLTEESVRKELKRLAQEKAEVQKVCNKRCAQLQAQCADDIVRINEAAACILAWYRQHARSMVVHADPVGTYMLLRFNTYTQAQKLFESGIRKLVEQCRQHAGQYMVLVRFWKHRSSPTGGVVQYVPDAQSSRCVREVTVGILTGGLTVRVGTVPALVLETQGHACTWSAKQGTHVTCTDGISLNSCVGNSDDAITCYIGDSSVVSATEEPQIKEVLCVLFRKMYS